MSLAMAAKLDRFWKGPEFLSPGPGGIIEEGHFLGEVEMRQLQACQRSGVGCVFHCGKWAQRGL